MVLKVEFAFFCPIEGFVEVVIFFKSWGLAVIKHEVVFKLLSYYNFYIMSSSCGMYIGSLECPAAFKDYTIFVQ